MMPSIDDTWASCGWTPAPSVITSPMAEMFGHRRPIQRVDLDVALLHRDAERLGAEPGGHGPAAGRNEQHAPPTASCDFPSRALRLDVDAARRRHRPGHLRSGERL